MPTRWNWCGARGVRVMWHRRNNWSRRPYDRMSLPADPVARKERLAEYRESGITLPIISPRVSGANAAASAQEIIRANAPA